VVDLNSTTSFCINNKQLITLLLLPSLYYAKTKELKIMEIKQTNLCNTVPHIRFWNSKTSSRNLLYPISVSYDCRLFYITGNDGSFIISEKHQNAVHGVMGGAIFTLADFTFAVAVNGLKKEEITVSLVSQISFLSSPKGSKLIAEAHCIKQGRSTSCYEISISDDTNRRIALVTFTGFSKN